jgi:hypothetical protein
MKTKTTTITKFALLLALGCTAACTTGTASSSNFASETTDKTVTKAEKSEVKTEANTASTETVKTETIKTDESPAGSLATPTATYKTAYAARQKKDLAALKRVMTKDLLKFMSILVGPEKTVDDALLQMTETPQAATNESRNEKINGDTATLEYPDELGKWKTLDFVKENGEWKITIPKPLTPTVMKKTETK